jgi:fermentation-respiration switch protein FrsA (DUF1100 family)
VLNAIVIGIVAYAAIVGALYLGQRQLLYLPDTRRPTPVESGLADMREVRLATADGLQLASFYRPPGRAGRTIVYFCGNGGHIGYRGFKVRPYLEAGYGVLLVGYRGYGGNPGSPTEDGLYADGRAALDFLAREGVPPAKLILYGESLGAAVAIQLAHERAPDAPVGGLVVEAPFTSMGDVAFDHYPFVPAHWLVKDRYENAAKIAGVKAPLLVVHGEADEVVAIRHGRRIFDAAMEPKDFKGFPRARHNDLYDFGAASAVLDFLARRLE